MSEGRRVAAAIVVAAGAGYLLMGMVLVFATVFDTGTDIATAVGGAVFLMILFGIVGVPIAIAGSAVVYGTTYLVLRRAGHLHGIAFPLVGAAAFVGVGWWDSRGPLFSNLESIATFIALVVGGAATGATFWRIARPPRVRG